MALVDYSGSESDSNNEQKAAIPKPAKSKSTLNKPIFQKVVDRSNPHKVKVSLPDPERAATEEGNAESGPPAKQAKIGSGAMAGFNSMLPAPKRTAAPTGGSGLGGMKRGGLGSGVSLKTGAAPAFSRESVPNVDEIFNGDEGGEGGPKVESSISNGAPSTMESRSDMPPLEVGVESKKKSNMFKPLSVANKKAQKKKVPPANSLRTPDPTNEAGPQPSKGGTKTSLFSTGDEPNEASSRGVASKGIYQPMVYHTEKPTTIPDTNPDSEESTLPPYYDNPASSFPQDGLTPNQPQSLDAIANDLNLSASAKRQLLGRHHNNNNNSNNNNNNKASQPSTIPNIVNFNTDEEYAANEMLRQAGETVQHNPVRGIAPGKHSLKQLVNAASNQKDALEEHFASGRRNKKEVGSKYGW